MLSLYTQVHAGCRPGKTWLVQMPRRTATSASASAVEATEPSDSPASAVKKPKKLKALLQAQVDVDTLKPKAAKIAKQLNELFPNPAIPLDHASSFQLLVAVVLSAQSTDVKVNEVTPELFSLYPDSESMAKAQVLKVQSIIKVLGLAPTKAKNIVALSQVLVEKHGGEVPGTFPELEALPGVGHKTASVVMSQVFGHPAFPVDTHIHRLAQRWGLTAPGGGSVEQTEADLKALFPEDTWRDAHLQIIYFGRQFCPAQRHDVSSCPICSWAAVPPYDRMGMSPPRPGKKATTGGAISARDPARKAAGPLARRLYEEDGGDEDRGAPVGKRATRKRKM